MTKTDVQTNEDIWKLVISFRIKKGFFENTEIMLAEKGKIVSEKKKRKKFFNDHYIDIAERSCWTKPTKFV